MRTTKLLFGGALTLLGGTFASAQYNPVLVDVIGQTAAGQPGLQSDDCYDGHDFPKEGEIRNGRERSEAAIQRYLSLARVNAALNPVFVKEVAARNWRKDGSAVAIEQARDPWAAQVARLEMIDFRAGNQKTSYRAIWKAYGADGRTIGTYEAFLHRTRSSADLIELNLYSLNASGQPSAGAPFCSYPGDIEKWRVGKAKRDEQDAAKREAKEAARSKQGNK